MADTLARLLVSIEAQTTELQKGLDRSAKQIARFRSDVNKTLGGIKRDFVTALAGVATVATVKTALNSFIDSASHLKNFSEQVNVSISSLVQLEKEASKAGIAQDSFEKSLLNLSEAQVKAVDGSKDAIAAFNAIGISQKELASLKTDELFLRLADRLKLYEDGGRKAAVVSALLGDKNVKLINLLNQGSAAITENSKRFKQLGDQYQETAEGADAFDSKLVAVSADLELLRNSFALGVLKSLDELIDGFTKGGPQLASFQRQMQLLGTGVGTAAKAFAILGVTIVDTLTVFSKFIGAIAASIANPTLSPKIFEEYFKDVKEIGEDLVNTFKLVFLTQAPEIVEKGLGDAADKGSKKIGKLSADVKTAAQTALETLKRMSQELGEQISTFDMSEAAAVRYRLTIGSLSDEVKKAGKEGAELSKVIQTQAETLDHFNRLKNISAGLAGVNAQIAEIQGDSAGAALINFDQSNLELFKDLTKEADQAGLKQLSTLRDLVGAQAQYNDLQEEASRIQENLSAQEDRLRNSFESGAISELSYLQELDRARSDAAVRLEEIGGKLQKISDISGSPKLVQNTEAFGHALENLKSQTDLLGQKFKQIFQDNFSDAFADFVTGTKTAADAFKDFARIVIQEIVRISAQLVVSELFKFIKSQFAAQSGGGGSDTVGTILGFLGQAVGAANGISGSISSFNPATTTNTVGNTFVAVPRAAGGPTYPGNTYLVGENGPEIFTPNVIGKIGQVSGSGNVTVNLIESADKAGQVNQREDDGKMSIDVFVTDIRGGGERSLVLETTYGLRRIGS